MPTVPYICTGWELPGEAEIYDSSNNLLTVIVASACFANWYCESNGYTWKWREGTDPDAPLETEDPPAEEPVATTPA